LRDIAYLPDGLNEFVYAPGGVVKCSVDADVAAYSLGVPDVRTEAPNVSIWYDKPLDFLGRTRLIGTILVRDDLGIIVPPQPIPDVSSSWLSFEVLAVAGDNYRHRAGVTGIFANAKAAGPLAGYLPLHQAAFFSLLCAPNGASCVATKAPLSAVLAEHLPNIVLGFVISALLAMGLSGQLHALIRRYWSFEARFRRHFKPQTIICTYQPILSLATSKISGCEVLVRWRDVDGSVVFPDQFLPVVEKHGLGRLLTEYVVQRAFKKLSTQVPEQQRPQVNFNIFPRDLDAAWLRDMLAGFAALETRFDPVVEIVETDEVDIAHAQHEIKALRRYGIKTHLDDFGTDYSNIQNLAVLDIAGVKLDRSFAMAAEGSLMSKMLSNAIDMIHAAGHRITIEGVETPERLRMLKATGQVDFIQGYLISRPLEIGKFTKFLAAQTTQADQRPRLVAEARLPLTLARAGRD